MKVLTDLIEVPGNSSRSFPSERAAQSQVRGRVQFGWDPDDPYLQNVQFDSRIIRYDSSYCTSVFSLSGGGGIPTLSFALSEAASRRSGSGNRRWLWSRSVRKGDSRTGSRSNWIRSSSSSRNKFLFARYRDAKSLLRLTSS